MEVGKAMDALRDEMPGALEILYTVSYFSSANIRTGMFLTLINDPKELKTALNVLTRYSFIKLSNEGTRIHIEKTIQTRVQKLLKERNHEEAALRIAFGLVRKSLHWVTPEIYDHAMSVFVFAKEYPNLIKEASSLTNCVVLGLMELDMCTEAYTFGYKALDILKESVGGYHPSTLALETNIGHSLAGQGKFEEALKLFSGVYEKESDILGRTKITETLFLIGKAMTFSTLIPEPEARLRKLVFGKVPVSETNNNSVLNNWCEYALLLADLSWTNEALQILRQVLKKRYKLLRPDDDDIYEVKENIARVYLKQKNFRKALEDFQKVYDKRKADLGGNSINTLRTREGIAEAFYSQGTYDKALTEYEEIAKKFQQISGEESQLYLSARIMVANVLFHQNEYEKSYEVYTKNYETSSTLFGEKDIRSLCMKYNIASALFEQNKINDALRIWEDVLEGYMEVLGPSHPRTLQLIIKLSSIKINSDLLTMRLEKE